ncbi:EpsG family protein [Hansschlegelia plantiphila]|uniref:EpsG family protein n=1 Tax=Hansschlegelia plantiphila TaxID=374655 RepID=A0A9W6MXA9_9HYPH|nr:EpsG family protein [Hansschlegelia plantiphila]GLK69702.1 hypothetical protein GCM10008179_33400 [Hansschlegelia plantiphila]
MIYNLIFFSSALANVFTSNQRHARHALYIAIILFLFVFVGFRWHVGCDWGSYRNHAESFGPLPFSEAFAGSEQAYWLLVIALNRLGFEYPAINVVTSAVFFLGVHSIARRQPDPLLYITLLFPLLVTGIPMSATRQALAMGILCFAFNAFQDRSAVRFVGWVVLAALFHQSAIAFICLAPILVATSLQGKIALGVLLAAPAAYFLLTSNAAQSYTDLYVGTIHDAAGGPARVAIVAMTGSAFLLFLRKRWRYFSPHDYELALYFSIIMIMAAPLVLYSSVIGDRFGYYTMLVAYIIQSKAYLMYRGSERIFVFSLPLIVSGAALLGWTQLSSIFTMCWTPYQTWWGWRI